jgi:hypothetical protein
MKRRSTPALVAWSVVGLIAGHQATYLAVYRDPAQAGSVLAATGHDWLWLAPIVLLSAALTALVVGFRGTDPVRSFRWRFAFLTAIQVVTFTILEIAERGASGIDLVALVDGGGHVILAVGAIIQTGVALLLAWGSHAVERIAAAFARTRPFRPRRRPAPLRRQCLVVRPAAGAPSGASAPRAPPAFA